jgi:methionine sulfoxide reductase heme-binding subunit
MPSGAPVGETRSGGAGGRALLGEPARGAPPNEHVGTSQPADPHQKRARRINPPRGLHPLIVGLSLLPFVVIAAAIASDFFQGTRYLGSNPIKEAEHMTGKWALRFVALTLAVTPTIRLSRQGWLIRYRRTFGLVAFFYACVHLTVYAVLDVELSWGEMLEDVAKRLYITIGMTALLLMIPLAITSTKGWIRRMGSARWNSLHRAVYATAVLGLVHYWMSVKKDITEPAIFGAIFAILLGWRVWNARRNRASRAAPAPSLAQPAS